MIIKSENLIRPFYLGFAVKIGCTRDSAGRWIMLSDQEQIERNKEAAERYGDEMIADIEVLRGEVPTGNFEKTSRDLGNMMMDLEKAYDKREHVIDVILEQGTGYETRKALRMVPTSILEKWAKELSPTSNK